MRPLPDRERADMRPFPDRAAARPVEPGPNDWTMQGSMVNIPRVYDLLSKADSYLISSAFPFTTDPEPYTFVFPAGRPVDAVALLADMWEPLGDGMLYLRRNLTNTAGASVDEDIDCSAPYDGSKGTYALTDTATVTAAGAVGVEARWWPANGGALTLRWTEGASCTYPLIPAALITEGDGYCYRAYSYSKNAYCYAHDPLATVSLPPDFTCGFVNAPVTYTGLNRAGTSLYALYANNDMLFWNAMITPGWLQAAGSADYALPNLSAVEGWQTGWTFSESAPVTSAYADARDFNYSLQTYLLEPLSPPLEGPPPDGTYFKQAEVSLYYSGGGK